MSEQPISDKQALYLNPVSAYPFADPFVLKHGGEYWGYSTGFWHDERCFGILHSRDLIHWREIGSAMDPLPGGHTCYWAPEVSYQEGKFLMYYSVGNETRMQIRVAVAEQPAGPFVDSGRVLTTEEFAIDPHVFIDDEGSRYMFYATDFLTHTHVGTGTVMDRMTDAFTLAGAPRPVTRARFDWQVYDPQRAEKGGVRWHTVEGPCVIKRKGRYYQMFSGGNWQNISYGVSYAFTDDIETTEEWQQVSDGLRVLPILRTLPGQVTGPGHNSIVRGPDNQQWFCVYHRWAEDHSARLMCIDRMDWVGQNLTVIGPSVAPQPVPIAPTLADFFEVERPHDLGENWECLHGVWSSYQNRAWQDLTEGAAEARALVHTPDFIVEVTTQVMHASPDGGTGLIVRGEQDVLLQALLEPAQDRLMILTAVENDYLEHHLSLPRQFAKQAPHLFRLEVNGRQACLVLDEGTLQWQGRLSCQAKTVSLSTRNAAACFAGFALTKGWESVFIQSSADPAEGDWQVESGDWLVADGQLQQKDPKVNEACIAKALSLNAYELIFNVRLVDGPEPNSSYGISLHSGQLEHGLFLMIRRAKTGWSVIADNAIETRTLPLAENFDPHEFQQFRFRKEGRILRLGLLAHTLGEVECAAETIQIKLVSQQAAVAFEMVRATALSL
jgi:GH43 family beta-xylosidase